MARNVGVGFETSVVQSRWQNKCAEWNLEKKMIVRERENEKDADRWREVREAVKRQNGECEYVHVSFSEKCLWKTKLEDSKDEE